MPSPRFTRFLLRTTHVESAREFYAAVLGGQGDGIVPLHEQALARGARPHWLGHVAVHELGGVEAVAGRFIERGATRLGPGPGVADFVVLRDPGGALVGLADSMATSRAGVVWHQLNTLDVAAAGATYTTLFGWSLGREVDLGALGRHREFTFAAGEPTVGAISDITGRPAVHPHWLFFWAVPSLDRAVAETLARGGKALGPITLPNGARIAACDDPQGAAFGIVAVQDVARMGAALTSPGS